MLQAMSPMSRGMSIMLILSMFVCGALCFGIPDEFSLTKIELPIQTAVLNLEEDGRTTCSSGGEAGVCYDPLNCLRLSGVFGNNCPGEKGICCLSTTPETTVYSSYSICGKKGPNYRTLNLRTNKNTSDGESKHFIEDTEMKYHSHNDSEFFEILRKLEEQISKDKFTTSNVHGRITFGQIAGSHEYPWQVGIKIRGKISCGASIISDQHILTAAHCVQEYQRRPHHLYMYFGNYNLETSSYERNVERVIIHPGYTRRTSGNDIAVLKLKSKITFSDYIRPVCLAPPGLETNYKTATVTGWGLDENKKTQTRLNELEATVISNSDCGQQWENKGAKKGLIKSNMMCLSPIVGDSCDGDSGGPSVMEVNNIYYQVGIVSFGSESCTDKSLPGVYTRVSSYNNWILQQMN